MMLGVVGARFCWVWMLVFQLQRWKEAISAAAAPASSHEGVYLWEKGLVCIYMDALWPIQNGGGGVGRREREEGYLFVFSWSLLKF